MKSNSFLVVVVVVLLVFCLVSWGFFEDTKDAIVDLLMQIKT